MTYRKLEKDEWHRLRPIFDIEEADLPNKDLAVVAISETDEGKIVGVLVLEFQLIYHSLWNHPDYRGRVMFTGLHRVMEETVLSIKDGLPDNACLYAMTETKNVEAMAKSQGFEPLDVKVYRLKLKPEDSGMLEDK